MEDMLFNLNVFSLSQRIIYIPNRVYKYTISDNSLVTKLDYNYLESARIIISELINFSNTNNLCLELSKAIDYKRFCLFYECIRKGPANDKFTLCKKMKYQLLMKIVDDETLDGRIRKNIVDWMSSSQRLYGILTKIKFYHILLFAIESGYKIKKRKGIAR